MTCTQSTVFAIKNAHFKNFVTELGQFLGGGWNVIIALQQHSQSLLTVRARGGGLFLSKRHPRYRGDVKKRQKSVLLTNSKIPNCGPASAASFFEKSGECADLVQE
jgi:hypothetical protein